jgi:hypothetical protein
MCLLIHTFLLTLNTCCRIVTFFLEDRETTNMPAGDFYKGYYYLLSNNATH